MMPVVCRAISALRRLFVRKIPSGTAMATARMSVKVASASVGSMRSAIRLVTVFLKKKLSPRSPVTWRR